MATSDEGAPGDKPKSKRIFINNIDLYQGRNLAKYLSRCVVGASLEEQEEEEETKSTDGIESPRKPGCYEIVGTISDKNYKKPDYIKECIKFENRDQLYEHLIECDIIIFDISDDPDHIDEAVWAVSELHSDLDKLEKSVMFILVSTVLTWAKSKPLDPDDPEIPFTEDDYRRRKPHPNFKEHISAEKTVIKMGKTNKSKLITYVIASALTYGAEENIFHYFFKAAWHNSSVIYCFGNGQNVVPTIHIKDLGAIIQNIADSRPKVRYLIAKDDSNSTLEEIVKSISQSLGNGKVKNLAKEEALLQKDILQADFDMLLVNLRMDAVHVKENMRINWVSETGIIENLQHVIKEYKDTRNLQPIRVCILGPPASGKTTIVSQLCNIFKLHHIKIKDVIDDKLDELQSLSTRADNEDEEEDESKAQEAKELLDAINEGKENNSGRIEDQYIISFFREKLRSIMCQNQGFILDGFPKTIEQAKELFQVSEEEEEAEDASKQENYDKLIMPEVVVCLEATDEFLKNRVMNLPESAVAGTHNTEDGLIRRLDHYRAISTEEDTVLNYFDELEFFPVKIDVTKDDSPQMKKTVEKISAIIGKPRNYGPTEEELAEIKKLEEETRLKKEAEEKAEKERMEAAEAAERKRRQEEWTQHLNEVKKEEYELLEAQSIPLRNYLMKHVMPTLTQGLIDCCKVRPDDPIDYLAEYLFQNNPQVD
ncbi:hypothetical protein ACJMK2_037057 [Sinanodonta woodiana]|uniref:Adenylate kinase 7 n=1 Tax=Sinanodonta woodiana TaxID=1069815 RepID=A0ABD3WMK8_SINWO